MGELSDYVTTKEAADMLGVSKPRVDQFVRAGRLAAVYVGQVRLILRADVLAFKKLTRPVGYPAGRPRKDKPEPKKRVKKK